VQHPLVVQVLLVRSARTGVHSTSLGD
jgi:hypothetical protein